MRVIEEKHLKQMHKSQKLVEKEHGHRAQKHCWFNPDKKHKTNNSKSLNIPNRRTVQYQNSIFVDTVIRWNHRPDTVACAKSLEAFKTALADQCQ